LKGRNTKNLQSDQHFYREKQRQQRQSRSGAAEAPQGPEIRNTRVKQPRQPKRQARHSRKIGFAAITVVLVFFATFLIYNLYQIQIVEYARHAEAAADLHYAKVTENPRRGQILDRNGVELAGTTYVYRIGITPKDVRSITQDITADEIAQNIAVCLNMEATGVVAALAQKDKPYVQLKKDVPSTEAEALKAYKSKADLGGIRIDAEPRRYYTNGTLASQVIGYTNYDQNNLVGQLGIEMQYNTLLTGEPGYTYIETDNYQGAGVLPFSVPTSLRAKDGQNVILNIDINIQKIAQEELQLAINAYDIKGGGTVIILNPYTGAVLAMASYPFFSSSDPTARPEGMADSGWDTSTQATMDYLSSQVWRNRAISDTYEPGSTMKAVTAAIALEEALTHESEMMSDEPIQLAGWTIRCSHTPNHGKETLQQGFWHSCNPIFATLALRTGISKYYQYIRSFGFANASGIDLPAEECGILHQTPSQIDLATLSYGESSTTTPLQMAAAFCTFANGGGLVTPQVVKAVTNSAGAIVKEYQPETIRKVISESTATRVRELLKGVVLYGTGSAAYVEGYAVAGKTGTSTDEQGKHTLAFVGLAPSDSPEIVAMVVLDKPADDELTSRAAAKTCGKIISRTLEYMGVSREYSDKDISRLQAITPVPDVVGMTYGTAMKTLAAKGFKTEAGEAAMGADTLVRYQWPAADTGLHNAGLIVLYPVSVPEEKLITVPDFTGKNVSECMSAAAEIGLNIRIIGDCLGLASAQDPLPTFSSGSSNEPGDEPDSEPVTIKRGSIVQISFATIEEEVAQSGESD
jgi:stage V sporulation protein D (sporulation-specific penicillin-binding protein)